MAWEMQAGDPLHFAFKIAFTRNPHGDADRSEPAMRQSWGNFSVWIDGENLSSHWENDELIHGAHWYLLPLLEWLAESWDALLHEQRLPLKNVGQSAAEAMAATRLPPLQLKGIDDFSWMDTWAQWWHRHNIRAAREGGLFPDVYIRRYLDEIEVSTGAEDLPGIPSGFGFQWKRRNYVVPLDTVSTCLHEVLEAACVELSRRVPESGRVQQLRQRVESLRDGDSRRVDRMAWLSGLGDQMAAYREVSTAVDAALSNTEPTIRDSILGTTRESSLVVAGTAYARLLYGAYSPTIDLGDVARLATAFVKNYTPDASDLLRLLDEVAIHEADLAGLPPGEQGSRLGEEACELIGTTLADQPFAVDIEAVIGELGILASWVSLSDTELRAVSAVGPTQAPHIFVNRSFARSGRKRSRGVRRFTLAHELCHLLLDRDRGDELAVASGPWAPVAIEQRANAFAAAFLMPSWLLRDALSADDGALDDIRTLDRLAGRFQVSVSSLVDRLYNLGELASDDRNRLRTVAQRRQSRVATAPRT